MNNECKERRDAELEFVTSAYNPDEAWCEPDDVHGSCVHRRLNMPYEEECIQVCLTLSFPPKYPADAALQVSATTTASSSSMDDNKKCPYYLQKLALNALPDFLATCRLVASKNLGEESVFLVLNRAEAWIQEEWPQYCKTHPSTAAAAAAVKEETPSPNQGVSSVLGRRLIYSHHIISKIKRGDIKKLSSEYNLTGYMKVGWPGLLIIEGREEDCAAFYDEIRPWSWQYLVVRGEQQESVSSIDAARRFLQFLEVDEMSLVARHCREVGLEALFRTCMKVYNSGDNNQSKNYETPKGPNTTCCWYAALVHVHHMNDGKAYRKWLRKCSQETDCLLLIKQCYKRQDFTKRPTIIVGVVGDKSDVSVFLKRWRTSRVDVDSRGKPCLERQMSIISEGELEIFDPNNSTDWEKTIAEDLITTTEEQMMNLISSVGGSVWNEAFASILRDKKLS